MIKEQLLKAKATLYAQRKGISLGAVYSISPWLTFPEGIVF